MVIKRDKVVISAKAKESIKRIVEYLKEEASLKIADKVRKGIIEECKNLKNFAGYSKERSLEKQPGNYRSIHKWDYIIIYTITEKEVRVLNITHASMHPVTRKVN